jgi:hypothetical protein
MKQQSTSKFDGDNGAPVLRRLRQRGSTLSLVIFGFLAITHSIFAGPDQPSHSSLNREWKDICKALGAGNERNEILESISQEMRSLQKTNQLPMEIAEGFSAIAVAERFEKTIVKVPPLSATEEELAGALLNSSLPAESYLAWFRNVDWSAVLDLPENENSDPAIRLLQRGRPAIPALVKLLDDQAGTRTTYADPQQVKPTLVLTRADIALALIETISRARFVNPRRVQFLQQMRDVPRNEVIQNVREWWRETSELSEWESLAWWVVRSDNNQRSTMISLFPRDQWDVANRCMREVFDSLEPTDAQRNLLARDLAQRGDKYGLQQILNHLGSHDPLRRQYMNTLMQFGQVEEFRTLARMLREDIESNKDEVGNFSRLTVLAVQDTAHPLTIPLCIEALESRNDLNLLHKQRNHNAPPMFLADIAAEHLQLLTDIDFGHLKSAATEDRIAVFDRILEWWEKEGKARYGFAAQEALSAPAIR